MQYWQVSAGANQRDYASHFLAHGLAFVGDRKHEARMGEVRAGDRLVLKGGKSEIIAVGEAVEREGKCTGARDKPWLHDFDGWYLPAYCHVRWHRPDAPIPVDGLTIGTILGINQPHIRELAERILREMPAIEEYAPEPAPTNEVEDDQVLTALVSSGLRPGAAEDLLAAFRRIRLLARYYYNDCDWSDIREHETRTFLVVPLLLALGWTEQQLKIELNAPGRLKIDLACFGRPYRRGERNEANHEDCRLIIETKGFGKGLDLAGDQARGYATHFPAARALVVTNGYCYKTFVRDAAGEFGTRPHAYLNLLQLQDAYPLDPAHVKGALEVLPAMMPQTWM